MQAYSMVDEMQVAGELRRVLKDGFRCVIVFHECNAPGWVQAHFMVDEMPHISISPS